MKKTAQKYHQYLKDRVYFKSSIEAIFLLLVSLVINFYAGNYAAKEASNSVTDIVLSNIKVYNLDETFVYGAFGLCLLIALLCLHRPQKLPFTIKSVALFIVIRSIFISLTHIGPFPEHAMIDPNSFITDFTFGSDLFFSGHTGLPFLMALVFWQDKYLRYVFIVMSIVFGIVVLLDHLHYSIDVLSAFFITYTIYHIAEKLFKKDLGYFNAS